jgi:sulfatase maturation enzyme AslB (radical SAM superfamily)
MKQSRYLRIRRRGGLVAVFHELHPEPVYVDANEWDRFQAGTPSNAFAWEDSLIRESLLIRHDDEDDAALATAKRGLEASLSVPRVLYLILAQGCNFSCGYCPIPRLSEKERAARLSEEDAFAGIRLWAKHLADAEADENYIIFYGGEPLLNNEVFHACLEEIKRLKADGGLPPGTALMLATNGSLLDEQVIQACREHDVLVALGIDGPKRSNDRLRVYAEGGGTHDGTLAMLKLLQDRGIRTAVSASLTPYMLGTLRELEELLRSVGVAKYEVNFLKGKALLDLVPEPERPAFVEACVEEVISRYRSTGDPSYEYQVEKKLAAFLNGAFFPIDCTCYGNQLVIRADGGVSNCPFFDAKLGHVRELPSSFRIAETSIVQSWRKRSPLEHLEFAQEAGKALAGPGCAWSSIDAYGNPEQVDEAAKRFSLAMFEIVLWLRAPVEKG